MYVYAEAVYLVMCVVIFEFVVVQMMSAWCPKREEHLTSLAAPTRPLPASKQAKPSYRDYIYIQWL